MRTDECQRQPLLEVEDLKKFFPSPGAFFSRSQELRSGRRGGELEHPRAGRPWAWWGEPDAANPPLGRLILRLDEPTEGRVFFEGEDISAA